MQVDPASGWLPKNPALSLAMFRASPASIGCGPGGTINPPGKQVQGRDARASPEHSQKTTSIRRFCPFEKCSANTLLASAHRCAAPASSITLRFEKLRLSRRPLSRKVITQSA